MAFTKKTWVARQGTGLNKFSINGATPVTVVNQPDSVTEQGDALSATNLNNLEQRIYDAFDAVADDIQDVIDDIGDGTIVAKKAEQDANGNDIGETYETKTDAQAISDDLQNTKGRVTSNTKRIANLEDKSEPFSVDYPDPETYGDGEVPDKIEDVAQTLLVEGETGITNQFAKNGDFSSGNANWNIYNDVPYTLHEGYITLNPPNAFSGMGQTLPINALTGHVIMIHCRMRLSGGYDSNTNTRMRLIATSLFKHIACPLNSQWNNLTGIVTVPSGQSGALTIQFQADGTTYDSFDVGEIFVRDLTPIFPNLTSAQIEALGVGGILALRPDLGKWNDFDEGSTITPIVTGMEFTGVNKWDEVWSAKEVDASTGLQTNVTNTRISNDNLIPVNSGEVIYMMSPSDATIYGFDINGNYIGYANVNTDTIGGGYFRCNQPYTVPNGMAGFRFMTYVSYGNVYNHDIQVADNSLPSDVKQTYHPYKHTEITFSEPVPLNGVNDAHDTLNPETGRTTHPTGSYTFTGNETVYGGSDGNFNTPDLGTLIKSPTGAYIKANLRMGAYRTLSYGEVNDKTYPMTVGFYNGTLTFYNPNVTSNAGAKSELTGKTIFFELATPDADTYIAPSPSAIEVEPYGELKVKQSQNIQLKLPFTMQYIPDSPYITKKDVIDNLESTETQLPLSANQGRVLDGKIASVQMQVTENTQEIQNLKVAVEGNVIQTNTDSTQKNTKVITSANAILPWAIMRRVGARSTQFNQLNSIGNFPNGMTGYGLHGNITTAGGSAGEVNFICTGRYGGIYKTNLRVIQGHKYLALWLVKGTSANTPIRLVINATDINNTDLTIGTSWTMVGAIATANASSYAGVSQLTDARSSGWDTIYAKACMFFDLTAMGMDTLTADQFKALFPASYYPYDAGSIINLPPTSFLARGTNQWDEEWINGYYNFASGEFIESSQHICSKNYIRCIPNTAYYTSQNGGYVVFYGSNHEYVGYAGVNGIGESFTTPVNAIYMMFNCGSAYGNTYHNDVIICLDSLTNKTYKPYIGQTIDTSDVPVGYVDSSYYNYKENVYVNGVLKGAIHADVIRTKVMKGTDGGWAYEHHDGYDLFYYNITMTEDCLPNYYKPTSGNEVPLMANGANAVSRNALTNVSGSTVNVAIQAGVSPFLMFCAPSSMNLTSSALFNAWLADHNVTIHYRTREDTQTVTYTDPIPNFPCEDGTTIIAITPQTDIVNAIDVPSTIVYGTKISA